MSSIQLGENPEDVFEVLERLGEGYVVVLSLGCINSVHDV